MNEWKQGPGWDEYQRATERGPWPAFWKVLGALVAMGFVVGLVGSAFSWWGNAKQTAFEQFSASALLKKYEWFKDAHAALDAKVATIKVYDQRLSHGVRDYGSDHSKWPRDVREQAAIWESEQAGIVASYNDLAAQYNAQMAKFNYRFTNRGDLPAGASEPLPREYAPYQTGVTP